MKINAKIFLQIGMILSLSLVVANIGAEEITLFRGAYVKFDLFGSKSDGALEVRFDTEKNIYYLYYRLNLTNEPAWIGLTENDLEIMRNNLKKFIEWDAIAQKEKANISRELPDSAINGLTVIQGTSYSRAVANNNIDLFFRFDTNTRACQIAGAPLLLIASNKVLTRANYDTTVTVQVMINITGAQARALLAGIEPNNLKRSIDKVRKQNDLFN